MLTWLAILSTSLAAAIAAPAARVVHDGGHLRWAAADSAEIPIDVRGNLIYLRGKVDRSDSLWIVLDSGASGDAMNQTLARALELEIGHGATAQGSGGTVPGGIVASVTIQLPGVSLEAEPIGTLPLDDMRTRTGRPMDAIVGYPLLSRTVARIDYARQRVTFYDPERFRYSGSGVVLPLTFDHQLCYVNAKLELPGQDPIDGGFVIDTGSSQAVILSAPFVRKYRVLEKVGRTIESRGHGVGGMSQSAVARIAGVEIGGVRLERPVATLRLSDAGTIAGPDAIGNLGGDVLHRFTVIFDYPHRRIILEPNAQLSDAFEADMAGLGVSVGAEGSHAFLVEWIQPDSPAEEAGIEPGDLIASVDGKPADEIGIPALRLIFKRHGDKHALVVKRGDKQLELSLTTRRMI